MAMKTKNRVVVYDRMRLNLIISTHKTWGLAEAAAKRRGCGDRFGLRLQYQDRPDCPA